MLLAIVKSCSQSLSQGCRESSPSSVSGEDLYEEIVQLAEVNLFNSSSLLVTSWEAVKAASVGN